VICVEALGRHVLAEIYDCEFAMLDDPNAVRDVMVQAAEYAGAEVREVVFHEFSPQGVSGVVVIAESHLTVHTWPELGYAAVDVFTCGNTVDPWEATRYICEHFGAKRVTASETKRGIFEEAQEQLVAPSPGEE